MACSWRYCTLAADSNIVFHAEVGGFARLFTAEEVEGAQGGFFPPGRLPVFGSFLGLLIKLCSRRLLLGELFLLFLLLLEGFWVWSVGWASDHHYHHCAWSTGREPPMSRPPAYAWSDTPPPSTRPLPQLLQTRWLRLALRHSPCCLLLRAALFCHHPRACLLLSRSPLVTPSGGF